MESDRSISHQAHLNVLTPEDESETVVSAIE